MPSRTYEYTFIHIQKYIRMYAYKREWTRRCVVSSESSQEPGLVGEEFITTPEVSQSRGLIIGEDTTSRIGAREQCSAASPNG